LTASGQTGIEGVYEMQRNKLDVQRSQQLVNQFKEEMAEEFGVYQPAVEKEAVTPKIIKQQKKEKGIEKDR
jgi:hypothetical protein